MRAPQFFRTGTGHRVEGANPWQLQQFHFNQLRAGVYFDVSSVRFHYGPPVRLPPVLTRPERLYVLPAFRGFYIRAFRSPGHPWLLPDITTTPN